MIGRYTSKMARDAGLAATMAGLALTGAITADWLKVTAMICAVGAGFCAFTRVPLAINELSGFTRRV